jgi:hypothetical protein
MYALINETGSEFRLNGIRPHKMFELSLSGASGTWVIKCIK